MDEEQQQQFQTSNFQQLSDPTFIKLKLDTSELLQRVEAFLSAKKVFLYRGEDGELYEESKNVGEPYANEEGVAAIMSMLDMRANNHSVQGNMDRIEFYDFLADTRKELTRDIVLNCYKWQINDTKLNVIIDTLLGFMRAFMSRTIDNKERESLMSQFHSREVISQQPKKENMLQNFAGGFK